MKTLDFELTDGTMIRAWNGWAGRTLLRLYADRLTTPGGCVLACVTSPLLRLPLARVRRVRLAGANPLTTAWDRDNPAQSARDLRAIVRLHFGVPSGK